MYEKYKKVIITGAFLGLLFILVMQSIADNYALRRADTTADSLRRELQEERERVAECQRAVSESEQRLEDCQNRLSDCERELSDSQSRLADSEQTLGKCYTSITAITREVGADRTELQSIISCLRTVRKEVEVMENALDNFYNKYADNDISTDNKGGDVK